MEKEKTRKNIGEEKAFDASVLYAEPTSIAELLVWLNEAKGQGATHVSWYARTDYEGSSEEVEAQAYLEEEETDVDFSARKAKVEEAKAMEAAKELEREKNQYELLKHKFEGGKIDLSNLINGQMM